ncbi:MAG: DUF4013 domain-containing protein [Methanobacteriaceae archaeon]|jgi:hypothetical protein|nr:DUF4013 domain-containing protein [Candidatus Methanorudis spinitermitis]
MKIVKLFDDSLTYPIREWKKLIILGILFVVMNIFNILPIFWIGIHRNLPIDILNIISLILLLIIILIISGYTLSITRNTINNLERNIPELDWVNNIIDGIKVVVLTIVYYIIPVIVTLITFYIVGAFDFINQIISNYAVYGSINQTLESITIGNDLNILIVLILALILYILFSLLFLVAKAVLAETKSLATAVNMIDVFKKIGQIKWKNYIVWVILFTVISSFINLVIGIIVFIPFIGVIFVSLIVNPYVEIFSARALGLIYNESKE